MGVLETGLVDWRCDDCGQEVRGRTGYIHVSKVDIGLFEVYQRNFVDEMKRNSVTILGDDLPEVDEDEPCTDCGEVHPQMVFVNADFLLNNAPPPLVPWQVHHKKCDPDLTADDFFIYIEQVDTWSALLRASVSIVGDAPFLKHTNWTDFVYRITEATNTERASHDNEH